MTYATPEQRETALGFSSTPAGQRSMRRRRRRAARLALLTAGIDDAAEQRSDPSGLSVVVGAFRAKAKLLAAARCPVDARIEAFLHRYLADLHLEPPPKLPDPGVVLFEHGIARELSMPKLPGHRFESPLLKSYRIRNGVLHNPKADRRTTAGTFHVA